MFMLNMEILQLYNLWKWYCKLSVFFSQTQHKSIDPLQKIIKKSTSPLFLSHQRSIFHSIENCNQITGIISRIAFKSMRPSLYSRVLHCPRPCGSCFQLTSLHLIFAYHIKSANWPETGWCCRSCSARYKAGRQAPAVKEEIADHMRKQVSFILDRGHPDLRPSHGTGSRS